MAGSTKANNLQLWGAVAPSQAPQFVLTQITQLLRDLALVFDTRYHVSVLPSPLLKDRTWFVDTLRRAAREMPGPIET